MDWNNLSSWLGCLVVGAFFVWMMRKGGCGMHGGHKHKADGHTRHNHSDDQTDDTAERGADLHDSDGGTNIGVDSHRASKKAETNERVHQI